MRVRRVRNTFSAHAYVAEVARPEPRALAAKPELDVEPKVLLRENLRRARFVNLLRLAASEHAQRRAPVCRHEGDRNACGVERHAKRNGARGRENAAPAMRRISDAEQKGGRCPDLASSPYKAVLTSAEVEMRDATLCASAYVDAP
jgi:hypothetical protein